MKRSLVLAITLMFSIGCTRNSITGRSQLTLLPETTLQQQALTQYNSFLSQNRVVSPTVSKDAEMVKRVGNRLAASIAVYLSEKGEKNLLNGYQWEFNLVDDKQVNAWCMPGGKVVVYTGLLPVTQNEAALAVVLGHEITHAVARHGNERMSQLLVAQGMQVAGSIFTQDDYKANAIFNNVFGPAAQVGVLLPNSRSQELEADRYGLIFTAIAGYNPREAIGFWQRMDAAGGAKPPEFLATHPSNENRIKKIKENMGEALKYYRPVSSNK